MAATKAVTDAVDAAEAARKKAVKALEDLQDLIAKMKGPLTADQIKEVDEQLGKVKTPADKAVTDAGQAAQAAIGANTAEDDDGADTARDIAGRAQDTLKNAQNLVTQRKAVK